MKSFSGALLAAGLLTGLSTPLAAEEYMFSGWLPPSHIMAREIQVGWADLIREASGGEVDFEVFVGGALLPPLGTMQGIASGVADAGHVAAPYSPSELPINNLAGELGYATPDPMVLSFAFLEFAMTDPEGYGEWRSNGVIPGATVSTPVYHIMCNEPFETLADLSGRRIRTPGGGWARFTESIGMVSVNVPASEIYTSLERGAVGCVTSDSTQLVSGSTVIDLIETISLLPLTPAYNALHVTYNPDFWQGLSDDQRRMMLDQTATAMARTLVGYAREAEEALDAAREKGIAVLEPDAEMTAAYFNWVEAGAGGVVELGRDRLGITDPEAVLARMKALVDKWVELMDGVDRTDPEAVREVLAAELFDQIDASTYGMD